MGTIVYVNWNRHSFAFSAVSESKILKSVIKPIVIYTFVFAFDRSSIKFKYWVVKSKPNCRCSQTNEKTFEMMFIITLLNGLQNNYTVRIIAFQFLQYSSKAAYTSSSQAILLMASNAACFARYTWFYKLGLNFGYNKFYTLLMPTMSDSYIYIYRIHYFDFKGNAIFYFFITIHDYTSM